MATTYKVKSKADEINIRGRKFSFIKLRMVTPNQQARLKEAYDFMGDEYIEKIEDKPKKKEGVLKDPLTSKKKKDEKEL
tara:strand:+ start:228 stop:464 length:237 start_codon:yes stop_codon:yes gene_type:complete